LKKLPLHSKSSTVTLSLLCQHFKLPKSGNKETVVNRLSKVELEDIPHPYLQFIAEQCGLKTKDRKDTLEALQRKISPSTKDDMVKTSTNERSHVKIGLLKIPQEESVKIYQQYLQDKNWILSEEDIAKEYEGYDPFYD